jgi:hypothetical protein
MAEATDRQTAGDAPGLVPLTSEPLAERIDRLERTIAGLQSVEVIEQRVLARLQSSPGGNGRPPEGLAAPDSSGVGGLVPASVRAVLPVLAAGAGTAAGTGLWGPAGVLTELRLMYRMYLDPRYRLSRLGQFGIPIVLGLMVANFFFTGSIPVVGFLLERIVLVVLSVALYKLLARDAVRYGDVLAYLARYSG